MWISWAIHFFMHNTNSINFENIIRQKYKYACANPNSNEYILFAKSYLNFMFKGKKNNDH
jgi:hypothetical protein